MINFDGSAKGFWKTNALANKLNQDSSFPLLVKGICLPTKADAPDKPWHDD